MKKKLQKKLSKINRSMAWFYRYRILKKINISYAYLMGMLNETSKMRSDVEKIILDYINEK